MLMSLLRLEKSAILNTLNQAAKRLLARFFYFHYYALHMGYITHWEFLFWYYCHIWWIFWPIYLHELFTLEQISAKLIKFHFLYNFQFVDHWTLCCIKRKNTIKLIISFGISFINQTLMGYYNTFYIHISRKTMLYPYNTFTMRIIWINSPY